MKKFKVYDCGIEIGTHIVESVESVKEIYILYDSHLDFVEIKSCYDSILEIMKLNNRTLDDIKHIIYNNREFINNKFCNKRFSLDKSKYLEFLKSEYLDDFSDDIMIVGADFVIIPENIRNGEFYENKILFKFIDLSKPLEELKLND